MEIILRGTIEWYDFRGIALEPFCTLRSHHINSESGSKELNTIVLNRYLAHIYIYIYLLFGSGLG